MARRKKNAKKIVTRKDIAKEMAKEFDMTATQAELLIQWIFSDIGDHVLADEEVWIMQFGQFYLQSYGSRRIRHPITGEEMVTKPTKTMKMKPASNFARFSLDEFEANKSK